jgi:hypothetical protein
MTWINGRRYGRRIAIATVALALVAGVGVALAATDSTPSNAVSNGRGINEFGMTGAFMFGQTKNFTYTQGFFCDTTVSASSSSKCEAGADYVHPPAANFDPLYITVPLGFSVPMNMQECPAGLVCVDHPGTIDLSRLEPALKPLYPQLTNAQLTAALRNAPVPGHDHFITTTNSGLPEWWDVKVIGVTSKQTYENIRAHRNFTYINNLIAHHDKTVVGPIPTNLFLFFSVQS